MVFNRKEHSKKYYQDNKEKLKQLSKQYRQTNKEKIRLQKQKHYQKNKEKINLKNKLSSRLYRQNNKEKIRLQKQKYYQKNKEKHKKLNQTHKQYNQTHRKEINKYMNERYKRDKDFRMKGLLRMRVGQALKKYLNKGKIMNSRKYGIDYQTIIEFLKPFPENLKDYHIHHIRPLFTFNFVNEDGSINLEEIKKAFSPENHKLLLIQEHKKINHFNIN